MSQIDTKYNWMSSYILLKYDNYLYDVFVWLFKQVRNGAVFLISIQ